MTHEQFELLRALLWDASNDWQYFDKKKRALLEKAYKLIDDACWLSEDVED
jgi:hypothetical protein